MEISRKNQRSFNYYMVIQKLKQNMGRLGRTDTQTVETDRWTDKQTDSGDRLTDRKIYRQTDRQTDKQVDGIERSTRDQKRT